MSFDLQRLYDLLPTIHRIRDAEQGEALKALLAVIAEQITVLEEDLEQLYDDQFIETCAAWAVPYIGDLIGYRSLHGVAPKVSSPRAEVAHTLGFRRRKGTAAMLEQLARDVTDWPARVVEFFQLLATTQYMNHIRPAHWYAPNLRQWEPLERLDTPFESVAHTVDVRRIANGRGRYNIPNLGIFLWRLTAYSLTNSPAAKLDDRRYLFSPLGNNTPLFTRPKSEDDVTHLAEPLNVPQPISRRVLDAYLDLYYGKEKSLLLCHADGSEIPITEVEVCDLSDIGGGNWAHQPPAGKVAIDPVLGRLAFAGAQAAPPLVTFHYGFSTDLGGGEYERAASFAPVDKRLPVIRVPQDQPTIQAALNALPSAGGVVEITDSRRYAETPVINVAAAGSIQLRAANEHRPTLVLSNHMIIAGGAEGTVALNGLLISADPGFGDASLLLVSGSLQHLHLRHCTLVPGLSLEIDGNPRQVKNSSLIVDSANVTVEINHCIIGGLRVVASAHVHITDSLVDATNETEVAYAAPGGMAAGGTLQIADSTVVGKVHTIMLELASNTIFLARVIAGDGWTVPIRAERKQAGCVRFSYLPLAAVVPRQYQCQPENAGEATRVRPQFTSLRYGDPGYGQLTQRAANEIRRGADDEGEMGAFHKLYQPQRETNVRVRLDEYLRFGLEAGIFYVT
jgi:hypothetical protein